MEVAVKQEKLKAIVSELAKDIKTEKDLGALTQERVKLTVETALGAELAEHLGYASTTRSAVAQATTVTAPAPSA